MDEFDAIASKLLPSRHDILSRVDEYSLYRFYLDDFVGEFIPGIPICSPLRGDDTVRSFNVFPAAKGRGWDEFEYTWKDHGRGWSGNIFTLIKILYSLDSYSEVYALINQDFCLDLNIPSIDGQKLKLYDKPEFHSFKISVKSCSLTEKGRAFWDQFRITDSILAQYNTTQIEYYWGGNSDTPTVCPDPTFAYRIGQHYQIYSPYAPKSRKFRNDLPANYFFGYLQLPSQLDLLVIDKSCKDVMFNRRLDLWAVCGKSETTFIPEKKMYELKERCKRMVLMLDNDTAGLMQTEKYLQLYPWLEPKFLTGAKDKTDLCKAVGFEQAATEIYRLLQ